jgi:hypothetical protein
VRVCGLALSTGILLAPLDPAVSRRILDHLTDCRRRNLPTRMTGCASRPEKQCRVQRQFDMRYACEYRRECYRTQLAGRRRALRGALDEGQIGCSLSIGHVSTTTRAGAGAAARAVDRTRRARRVVGARRGDVPLVLNEGGFRQTPQAAPKVSPSEAVGGEGVCRDFQAATVRCDLVPVSRGPVRHIDTRRSTSPAVTARRPPAGKSAQVHRDAPLPRNHQDQSGHEVGTDFGATSQRANLRS